MGRVHMGEAVGVDVEADVSTRGTVLVFANLFSTHNVVGCGFLAPISFMTL